MNSDNPTKPSSLYLPRRTFLAGSTAALAASAFPAGVHAQGNEELKIALIGCGGRGTGAASQALQADDQVKLWAMADIDEGQLERSRETLEKGGAISRSPEGMTHADKMNIPPERRFIGLDAYRRVMEMGDIDLVILTTPPGFRPIHFEAAVRAGKHVFMEKPVAVDGPGIRQVLAAAKEAKAKNLKVGVGLNRRHSPLHHEMMKHLHDGEIGDIEYIRMYNCRSGVGKFHRREEGETELEYQVKHWYFFTWLSGDFIVEQSVHDYDVVQWMLQEAHPVQCQGQGGRLVRSGKEWGQIYDHFYIEYDYQGGTKVITQHRHMRDCWNQVGEELLGRKGKATLIAKQRGEITPFGAERPTWRGMETGNSYQLEHDVLFKAIRENTPHNEAERGAHATLAAIMGRMAAYTGKVVTWEDALNAEESIVSTAETWDGQAPIQPDEDGFYPVPMPGQGNAQDQKSGRH